MLDFRKYLMQWMGVHDENEVDRYERQTLADSLSLPPVWYAHNKICGDIGMLPVDVKRVRGQGAVTDEKHDGYRLFREQPNMLQSPSVFKEQLFSHAIMYGNGRSAIIREGERVKELIPLLPDRTRTVLSDGIKYHITKPKKDDDLDTFANWEKNQDEYIVFPDADVLHIPGFSFNGLEGIGLLQIAASTFSIGVDSQSHVRNQLKKGFRGKIFLEAPPGAFRKEEDAKEFLSSFNKSEGGPENASKAGLLREGIKANAVNMTNTDAQFVELQKFTRQDVGLLFGIDSMPGDGDSVSYNSLEQKNIAYMIALDRWLVKLEEQCDIKLRTPTQKRLRSHYFKVNRAAILRTDTNTTKDVLTAYVIAKIMNRNEARAKLDLNPVEGGDVFENPAITPGDPSSSDSQDDNEVPEDETVGSNARAVEEMVRSLISREANDAIAGTRRRIFCDWIDNNYAKWEPKFADKLESIGIDRDLARIHCDKSREMLLQVAQESTQETLMANVTELVKDWKNRVYSITGVNV
jgi:HK97 family phage portal protein